ncbi:short chain dehydrogenase [Flammeovirga agarivorans]|uniref:Short chain dehydrogenase n=1 Tax=Flammeovirga agarivorans TaxID=2726742 RepID=A0A7X8XW20_9BACT|nr:short chain dehydrogenase [Flammeovirga agarivorans]NLR91831.1 short chain dehydrogenase [Flammeovirga agarivorans]
MKKMKIAVIGGTGTIGSGIVELLRKEHDVISIGRKSGDYQVDLLDTNGIKKMFNEIQGIDGIISTVGDGSMGSLKELELEAFHYSLNSKVIANVNLIKEAISHLKPEGFVIVTSGLASTYPIPNASALAVACAALEAFVRCITVEDTNGVNINVVSPGYVKETMESMGMDSTEGISVAEIATIYKDMIDKKVNGMIAKVPEYLASTSI